MELLDWRGPREGLQSRIRDWSTFHRKTLRELALLSLEEGSSGNQLEVNH